MTTTVTWSILLEKNSTPSIHQGMYCNNQEKLLELRQRIAAMRTSSRHRSLVLLQRKNVDATSKIGRQPSNGRFMNIEYNG
jgi:hypothetical protein